MKKIALCALPLIAFGAAAHAEEASYPAISGEISFELQNDWTHKSDDPSAEIDDLYPMINLATTVSFTPELSVNLEATLEPVEDATGDRAFEDLGGYVGALTVNYDTNDYSLYAGKFSANFGIAWDATPGLSWGNLSEDYELAEMLGLGGSLSFNASGRHTVSASTFFADTTFLSDSAGTSRGPVDKPDGGVANTESLESFAVALDGYFEQLEGFRYHVGFSSAAEGDDGTTNQLGYAAGAEYEIPLNEDLTLTPLFEVAYLDDAGGIKGDNTLYTTAGLTLGYGNWTATSSYQRRDIESAGGDTDDYIADVTLGYEFDFGLGISTGYRFVEEGGVDSRVFGILAAYTIEF
ncbi:hypothetical protein A9Q83_10505 [Alphaproteobacteria bacterium 46_93_T64]|nr:hypothetical protein A9Q83_10505 [Alphaproteobacteria bacterium 46_93_T64]